MKKILISVPILLALGSALFFGYKHSAEETQKDYIHYDWAKNKLWDDGMAEVALYEATKEIYGKSRPFEYVYILVKEEFNKAYRVKTDDYSREDLYSVMKINKFCRVETLAYPYHFLTSVFMHRDNPESLHKLSHTSQEWCGTTSKQFLEKGNKYQYDYMSYFDGEGSGQAKIEQGPWFEDQLSYSLRTLNFTDGLEFDILLYPTQVNNKAELPKPVKAHVRVMKSNPGTELEGLISDLIQEPWKVIVAKDNQESLTYWINNTYPNYILKMESTDGRSLLLKEIKRDKYWDYE
tara:strand:- start:1985 stop:2863 length:879 start_codon:yes stop_codon:yes gene_type:complete